MAQVHEARFSIRSRTNRMSSSMQVTREADYGVRAMVTLAGLRDRRSVLGDLVSATETPESFLSKVLQKLVTAGLITSRRGPAGGFQITDSGLNATLLAVVEAIEGPIALNQCLNGRKCSRANLCPARSVWQKAQTAMLQILDSVRIADLATGTIRSDLRSGWGIINAVHTRHC